MKSRHSINTWPRQHFGGHPQHSKQHGQAPCHCSPILLCTHQVQIQVCEVTPVIALRVPDCLISVRHKEWECIGHCTHLSSTLRNSMETVQTGPQKFSTQGCMQLNQKDFLFLLKFMLVSQQFISLYKMFMVSIFMGSPAGFKYWRAVLIVKTVSFTMIASFLQWQFHKEKKYICSSCQ